MFIAGLHEFIKSFSSQLNCSGGVIVFNAGMPATQTHTTHLMLCGSSGIRKRTQPARSEARTVFFDAVSSGK